MVRVEAGRLRAVAGAGQHDTGLGSGEVDCLSEGVGCVGGHVHDDVRSGASGRGVQRLGRVLLVDVDGEVGTEGGGRLESRLVVGPLAGDHHEVGAGLLRRGCCSQSPDPGAQDGDDVTGTGARQLGSPADPGTHRVEQRGVDRVEAVGHRQHHRVGTQGVVCGPTAGEFGADVERGEPIGGSQAVGGATTVGARSAGIAGTTRLEALDGHPVADGDTPCCRSGIADLDQHADGLMAGNEGRPDRQAAGEEFVVGAAEPARLDLEESRVGRGCRDGEVAELERPWCTQHQCP